MKLILRAVGITALLFAAIQVTAQHYYVVVGAYATVDKAENFSNYVQRKNLEASFLKNSETSLYYVFILQTNNKAKAYSYMNWIQDKTEFKDVWVYHGTLRDNEPSSVEADPANKESDSRLTQAEAEQVRENVEVAININEDVILPDAPLGSLKLEDKNESLPKPRGKYFKFTIIGPTGELLSEKVHHVDLSRGVDIGAYNANNYIDVLRPRNRKKEMTLICGIFGYQEVVKNIDYINPSRTDGAYQDDKGVWVIPFQLQRLQRGDASVMYNLAFYKDAVVMLPQSKADLDKLVKMMIENPGYVIKVHGHCNGNHKRKIIALGDNKNYFEITGADELNGSAKDLGMLRAQSVRSYLVDHGVEGYRISIRSWGGQDMLVNKDGPSSKLNDRIEIEVLRD